jgi:hypothetical protein
MKYLFRIFNVIISGVAAKFVFSKVYDEYYSYLPKYEKLDTLNNAPNIAVVLRENSLGLRELYNHALERSILYSAISFIALIFLLEYLKAGNFIFKYFNISEKKAKVLQESEITKAP